MIEAQMEADVTSALGEEGTREEFLEYLTGKAAMSVFSAVGFSPAVSK